MIRNTIKKIRGLPKEISEVIEPQKAIKRIKGLPKEIGEIVSREPKKAIKKIISVIKPELTEIVKPAPKQEEISTAITEILEDKSLETVYTRKQIKLRKPPAHYESNHKPVTVESFNPTDYYVSEFAIPEFGGKTENVKVSYGKLGEKPTEVVLEHEKGLIKDPGYRKTAGEKAMDDARKVIEGKGRLDTRHDPYMS